ncbi:hypothetical protein M758_10G159400 [Ceratodon purpureus]|uniref:Uncharacterized protein n=1 Tax=Ceratodon purpureus TaxID=3225 RepID=A0A8T0GRB2_CERPU|nr:hypothetical protein KC19_10G164200 [Ceratodon purpureus]KAG0604282.1 hypothetical protein M758_10G159400 [Ceratodon purpureus]
MDPVSSRVASLFLIAIVSLQYNRGLAHWTCYSCFCCFGFRLVESLGGFGECVDCFSCS